MIDVSVKIHDKYQLEIKFNHLFDENKKITSYEIDSFVFIPNSLGINYSTYKKHDFYNDVQNYIRFKTPVYLLEQIIYSSNSPYLKLKTACEELVNNPCERTISEYEYQVKMFSCVLKSSIRDYVDFITSKTNTGEIVDLIENYNKSLKSIMDKYRLLKKIINVPTIEEDTYSIYLYGDEYNSLLIVKCSFNILEYLKNVDNKFKEKLNKQLLSFISQEIKYRQKNEYDSVPAEDSDNELLIFRFSVLKKYLESVLFIDTSKKPEGILLKQLLISIAAGLAMLFATAIAFWGHNVYGDYSLPIFITLIISYMFKDRIKELTRIFFTNKILKRFFDHRIKIHVDKKKIGVFRESFNFIARRTIPKTILKMRSFLRSKEFDNKFSKENIIYYHRKIKLYKKVYKRNYYDYNISGINDILRINISKFLNKMDNPNKPIFLLTSDGYQKNQAKRVYHLNLIMKYMAGDYIHYVRYRIVMTRRGIKRIEKINTSNLGSI